MFNAVAYRPQYQQQPPVAAGSAMLSDIEYC